MARVRRIVQRVFAITNTLIHPTHLTIISRDLFKLDNQIGSARVHLRAVMDWLCRSQDVTGCGGSSGGYYFAKGWMPPYPETTGYIIPTFLRYASLTNDSNYLKRAEMIGDWEIRIQLPSGAVRGGMGINEYPVVFNTGQVILGWTALYEQARSKRFIVAAIKAADWLLSVQDGDGKWSKHTYKDLPHAYDTTVAWALLEVYKHTSDQKYKNAAEKNILWVLSLAKENAWFCNMSFDVESPPLTHTIGYTLQGLMESSFLLEGSIKQEIVSKVVEASENIMRKYECGTKDPYLTRRYLPATLNDKWNSNDNYSCLTGNAQVAIIWLQVYGMNNDARFLNAALRMNDEIKKRQRLNSKNSGIRGGIQGSYPIWGRYCRFAYLNWAAKFFADALMLQAAVKQKLEGGAVERGR